MNTAARYKYLILFTLPALAFYAVFAVFPLVGTLGISLFQGSDFSGFANYAHLFGDAEQRRRFVEALVNNVEFFAIHLVVQLPVALLMAALLTSGAVKRLGGTYRTLLFIPTTLSVVIVGFIWRMIISPLWGIVDTPLLGQEATALPTISLMSIWEWVGIPMIFLYSALIAIPDDIIEAARLDGANGVSIFWRMKFPLIKPQFALITILTFIWTFNGFDIVFALNGCTPGPNYSTDILGTLFYRNFFGCSTQQGDTNLGAATASVIFLVILVVTAGYFVVLQRRLKVYEL